MPTLIISSNPITVPLSTAVPSSLPRATTLAPSSIPSIPRVSALVEVIYELKGICECTDVIITSFVAVVTEQLKAETQDIDYIIKSVDCTPLCSNSPGSDRSLSSAQDKLQIFFAFIQSASFSDADKIIPLQNMIFLLQSNMDSTVNSISTRSGQIILEGSLTLLESPSAAPSWSPSMFRSAFDGDNCRFDVECQIGTCDKQSGCRSEVLEIAVSDEISATKKVLSTDVKPLLDIPSWGGSNIDSTGTIHLYGDVRNAYTLSSPIVANKFTKFKFSLYQHEAVGGIGLCFLEKLSAVFSNEADRKCLTLNGGRFSSLPTVRVPQMRIDVRTDLDGDAINIALGKDTEQSSIFGPGTSDNAVDGNLKSKFDYEIWELNSVTHTKWEKNPWWEIDLGESYKISNIVIFRRSDEYGEDLSNSIITLFDSGGNNIISKDIVDVSGDQVSINFDGGVGQRIRVTMNGKLDRVLCMAEVQVFGFVYTFEIRIGKIFNFPPIKMRHIVFVQELGQAQRPFLNESSYNGLGSTQISDMSFTDDDDKTVSLGQITDWVEVSGLKNLRMRGSASIISSKNGLYTLMRTTRTNEFVEEKTRKRYVESLGDLKSFSISDTGRVVACFYSTTTDYSVMRVLDLENFDKPRDTDVWAGVCTDAHITPSSTKAAIGFPKQNSAHTYSINETGVIDKKSLSTIKLGNISSSSFGDSVALSENGLTLAVAAPGVVVDAANVGAVYVYVWLNGAWNGIESVLYGVSDLQRLGNGGVVVDDRSARVDIRQADDSHRSFKLNAVCDDPYAQAKGKDMNAFRPMCECMSGYKSSNIMNGNILIDILEVCRPCKSSIRCGRAPTMSPTLSPSKSTEPSGRPSVSAKPTLKPTSSSAPSPLPTSGIPTYKPTLSSEPSFFPTSSPTKFFSVYDGDYCMANIECRSSFCVAENCRQGQPLSLFEQLERGDQYLTIPMLLVEHAMSTTETSSGIVVESSSYVRVYGNFFKVFALMKPIAVNKFSRLRFTVECPSSEVSICLYENTADIYRNIKTQCHTVQAGEERNIDIRAGELLKDKRSDIFFIALAQNDMSATVDAEAFISTLSISPGLNTDIVDENGQCKDVNAETISGNGGEVICRCVDGFKSSNGGRIQNKMDSCVDCLVSPLCAFEGDECLKDDDCIWNSCVAGRCEAVWPLSFITRHLADPKNTTENIGVNLLPFDKYNITNFGGITTEVDGVLHLHGDVAIVYELLSPIAVNKFVHLKMKLNSLVAVEVIRVCLYESEEDAMRLKTLVGDEYRCNDLPTSGNVDINIGGLFEYRITSMTFVSFEQLNRGNPLSGSTLLSDISFEAKEKNSIIDSNNNCVDRWSDKFIGLGDEPQCLCTSGYVASNGGKFLDTYDTCIKCLPTSPCALDGQSCSIDRECSLGSCKDESCVAGSLSISVVNNTSGKKALKRSAYFLMKAENYSHNTSTNSNKKGPDEGFPKGGTLVQEHYENIHIYGSVDKIYQIESPIEANKFTQMSIELKEVAGPAETVTLCLYEGLDLDIALECSSRCRKLEYGMNLFKLSRMFHYREASVQYIRIKQAGVVDSTSTTPISALSNILFSTDAKAIVDENGLCVDTNALTVQSTQGGLCKCLDGFVSSNGGKVQGANDACVSCMFQPACSIDAIHIDASRDAGYCAKNLGVQYQKSRSRITLLTDFFETRNYESSAFPSLKLFNAQSGGSITRTTKALSLHGNVWNVMKLVDPHTFDEFSRLRLDITISVEVDFVILCFESGSKIAIDHLNGELGDEELAMCIQLHGSSSSINSAALFANLALGKPASQSSTFSVESSAKNAVDGALAKTSLDEQPIVYGVTKTVNEDDPWWEVNLEGLYPISKIIVHMNFEIEIDMIPGEDEGYRPSNLSLVVYDDVGIIVFRDLINTPEVVNDILMPLGVFASRVVISLPGEAQTLALSEVIVVESVFGPTRHFNIPIGALWDGKTIQYLAFLQRGDAIISESYISDVTFVYGYSPERITPNPTASPTNQVIF